ncbi:hypothetical protein BH10PSE12_BH10PSE12_06000 [soil metagenome]
MIASEAGYSKGAVYSNFPSKEAIFLELLDRYADEEIAEFQRLMELPPDELRETYKSWLETMHLDEDWALLTTELQAHAQRRPEFAERFYAIDGKLTKLHADIIAERFARLGQVPPLNPTDLSLALRTLACSLNLKFPPERDRKKNEAGRIVFELLDFLLSSGKALSPNEVPAPARRKRAKNHAPVGSVPAADA